jgi:hypothetical protein
MNALRPIHDVGLRRWARAAAAGLVLGSAACTLLLDRSSTQCQSDADCAKFGGHPFCQSGMCAKSGLGPRDCFYGTPQQQPDFLNQCSTAECLSFDDCQRLQLCSGAASDVSLVLVAPKKPDAGAPTTQGAATDAGAMPSCQDPDNGRAQVVYMTGSSNFPPLLAKLAPIIIAAGGPTPVFLITNSCTGVKSAFSTVDTDHFIRDPAPGSSPAKYAAYFGQDGTQVPCTLGSAGARVDIGESDIFSSTCPGFGPPGDAVNESVGPNQAMAFVVPGASGQTAISEAAAREVFGMAGNSGVAAPWIDPARYFVRNANTGTQQMIGHAIGVPADQFWGIDQGTASAMDQALKVLTGSAEAERAIGIISVDWYDNDRKNLKALAYRAAGQECAYLPDSSPDAMDKRNVRDGHYPIWGPLHFFTVNPLPAAAGAFLSFVTVPKVDTGVLDAFIGASLVPTCAMTVQRSAELAVLTPYSAPFQCGCYFESKRGSPPPECTGCGAARDCPATRPACNLNFCEVQ